MMIWQLGLRRRDRQPLRIGILQILHHVITCSGDALRKRELYMHINIPQAQVLPLIPFTPNIHPKRERDLANNSLVIKTVETLTRAEQRKFLKDNVVQLFVQQIYSAVVRSLVAFGSQEGDFVLNYDEINFLARTFYREKLGSREAAFVCLGPAWDHHVHKGEHCELKKRQQRGTSFLFKK